MLAAAYLKRPVGENFRASSHAYWRVEDAASDGIQGGALALGQDVPLEGQLAVQDGHLRLPDRSSDC